MPTVLVIYCDLTESHKLGGLKLHTLIILQFLSIRSLGTTYLGSLLQGLTRLPCRYWRGCGLIRDLTGERSSPKLPHIVGRMFFPEALGPRVSVSW